MSEITPQRDTVRTMLFGRKLATAEAPHQTISKTVGLAVFASDALSSVAYATQEILIILSLAGAAYFGLSIPISFVIIGLLIVLTISYRQTIFAYPGGGGAYIVARDNLGDMPALTAAAALLTDYILTVAVSISSGVAQVTSAVPSLYPWRVELALVLVALITIINLRGVRESGTIFAVPTYFFVVAMLGMLALGFWQQSTGALGTVPNPQVFAETTQTLTLFLILKAFASGCTALTGVEAISNGIMAFKEPRSKNAAQTLVVMSALLGVMFIGITMLGKPCGGLRRRGGAGDGHLADCADDLRHRPDLLHHDDRHDRDPDYGGQHLLRRLPAAGCPGRCRRLSAQADDLPRPAPRLLVGHRHPGAGGCRF